MCQCCCCCCEVYYETSMKTYGNSDVIDYTNFKSVFFPRTYTIPATHLHHRFHGPTPLFPRTYTKLPRTYTELPRTYTRRITVRPSARGVDHRFLWSARLRSSPFRRSQESSSPAKNWLPPQGDVPCPKPPLPCPLLPRNYTLFPRNYTYRHWILPRIYTR